ncbi:DEAD/DEAH box helicase [Pannonibacter sp. SL95]|uniref:DEAD/DEAH box helicase n=1 Tax=Pannonibacter sp. SL95 TaxID=2995153 RepID=UPI00227630C9|nr:DEAD/DEAH box helicase [Pannonibacter sp. SL95]MCY1707516.1 DEAD/DEAH box helicase [Pannonibacter sp. SL95]
MSFDTLGLSEKVLQAVAASGYTEPTAIQKGAIPYVIEGRDVLGIAQTGTGKTASFTLPMLTKLEKGRARSRMPRTLILEPTRELAAQVQENFEKYGVNHKLNVALLIGGVSFGDQDKKIDRGADVLIATPGRLLDHVERGKLLLQGVEILVIDEADRMLDMGFIPDIERICKLIPFTRQTLFFSATMPPEIQRLTETFLQNPAKVEVSTRSSTSSTITQYLVATGGEDYEKRQTLRDLLAQAEDLQNAIVFCNRKVDVATLFRSLERHGFNVGALHGDMDQRTRMTMLDNFRKGNLKLLVASDVAARGLDIPDVSHVFNFDVPIHAEDYVHRIGRTGRAGRTGVSYTLVSGDDAKYLAAIEKVISKTIDWLGEPLDFEAAIAERKERRKAARAGGGDKPKRGPLRERTPRVRETTEDAGEAPRRERTRKPRVEAPAEDRATEMRQPREEAQPRQPRPQRDRAPRRDRGQDHDEPVIGLGDHVPAFLLRDPRAKKAS